MSYSNLSCSLLNRALEVYELFGKLILALGTQAMITIRISPDFSAEKAASGLEVVVPMPREVQRVHCDLVSDLKPAGAQSWDWQEKSRKLVWKFKRVQGGTDQILRVRKQPKLSLS